MITNIQPIEKQDQTEDGSVDVHSIFYTIQGEGPLAGQPAVFVRLAGCNLQCPACDTDYTSSRTRMHPKVVREYIEDVLPNSVIPTDPLVVITGGEPFRQRLMKLVQLLLTNGFRVQIETNGTLYQDLPWKGQGGRLVVVCSPKAARINDKLLPHIHALKYVVKAGDIDETDGLPIHALDHSVHGRVARPPAHFPMHSVYVQPIDVQDEIENQVHLQAAIGSVMKFGYTLCLQTHKIINLP